MAPLSLTYGHASHIGLRRSENQDACGVFPPEARGPVVTPGRLFVVADGMGGHVGGREASRMAVEGIEAVFYAASAGDPSARLLQAFEAANRQIYERARFEPSLFGMGTTCTALVLDADRAWIAHVGDSRAYHLSEAGIRQLTDDHTRVGELVRRKLLTEEEAARHPNRNILNRAMGVQRDVEVDLFETPPLRAGEAFLLCSDGLAGVSSDEIRTVVLSLPPQEACDRLVELANERGGHDNVTVVVVRAAEAVPPPSDLKRFGLGGLFLFLLLIALTFAMVV